MNERTAHYTTPNGQSRYRYADYTAVGAPTGSSRAFQTLIKQQYASSTWSDSPEQFFYRYTSAGRLEEATFAHTYEDLDPEGEHFWAVSSRGRTLQRFDAGGRLVRHCSVWDEINLSQSTEESLAYGWTEIGKAWFEYAYGAINKDLRTSMSVGDWSGPSFVTSRTEIYGYDELNQLTYVDYNHGLSNEVVEWDYDAAGNRKSDSRYSSGGTWTYDWLNRMTQSPSLDGTGPTTWNYSNDILGNRTNRNFTAVNSGAALYTWDALNRMTNLYRPSLGASYYYRADGMRVEKVDGATLNWIPPDPASPRSSGHYDTDYSSNRATTR